MQEIGKNYHTVYHLQEFPTREQFSAIPIKTVMEPNYANPGGPPIEKVYTVKDLALNKAQEFKLYDIALNEYKYAQGTVVFSPEDLTADLDPGRSLQGVVNVAGGVANSAAAGTQGLKPQPATQRSADPMQNNNYVYK